MAIRAAIEDAKGLSNWLSAQVHDIRVRKGLRGRLAAAALSIVLDHHRGLIALLENGCDSSFMALLRPQMEACLRAAWLIRCAEDEELQAFASGTHPPRAADMFKRVEEVFATGTFARVFAEAWPILCDFSHTGKLQIQRNMTTDTIRSNHPEEELLGALEQANAWAMIAATLIADLAENRELGDRLIECARERAARAAPAAN